MTTVPLGGLELRSLITLTVLCGSVLNPSKQESLVKAN